MFSSCSSFCSGVTFFSLFFSRSQFALLFIWMCCQRVTQKCVRCFSFSHLVWRRCFSFRYGWRTTCDFISFLSSIFTVFLLGMLSLTCSHGKCLYFLVKTQMDWDVKNKIKNEKKVEAKQTLKKNDEEEKKVDEWIELFFLYQISVILLLRYFLFSSHSLTLYVLPFSVCSRLDCIF